MMDRMFEFYYVEIAFFSFFYVDSKHLADIKSSVIFYK